MPWMNFDLQDGKPLVGFGLKADDCDRFAQFMAECDALRAEVESLRADAERYRWIAENQPDIDWISDPDNQIVVWAVSGHGYRGRTLGDALDAARAAQEGKT